MRRALHGCLAFFCLVPVCCQGESAGREASLEGAVDEEHLDLEQGFLEGEGYDDLDDEDADLEAEAQSNDDLEDGYDIDDEGDHVPCPEPFSRQCASNCLCCDGPGAADCVACERGYACYDRDKDGAGECHRGEGGQHCMSSERSQGLAEDEEEAFLDAEGGEDGHAEDIEDADEADDFGSLTEDGEYELNSDEL
eukprot:TRINITY_DN42815_c0_g1_i1.p1 TRINITY_DN42815_c0_g1~~TRINITY_DN42815_c0_g1_i1.p1  ORF type:complete len:195 (-),score=47.61 TRINITY_DN42815_c0_g1_i1:457-1041(-)